MTTFKSPLELYKILPKTNCRRCGLPSCLAFAAEVIKGDKRLSGCPYVSEKILAKHQGTLAVRSSLEEEFNQSLAALQAQVAELNFQEAAERCGAVVQNNTLKINCLGNKFELDSSGRISSHCHTNSWFTVPLLNYVLHCKGTTPGGEWVSYRELRGGSEWNPLYIQRCEKPLKQLADKQPDLFADLVDIFSGRQPNHHFDADIGVQLLPYPKLPLLICYWKPEEDLASKLQIFYDKTASDNLGTEHIYRLSTGLVVMFKKISARHLHC